MDNDRKIFPVRPSLLGAFAEFNEVGEGNVLQLTACGSNECPLPDGGRKRGDKSENETQNYPKLCQSQEMAFYFHPTNTPFWQIIE
jgi:hypothetical protein